MKLKDGIFGLVALSIIASATFAVFKLDSAATLHISRSYPQWLRVGNVFPDQTSGITFIKSEGDKKYFLIADDIGELHTLIIANDTVHSISSIILSETARGTFPQNQKWDFEEIIFDRYTNSVFLSLEGNGPNYKEGNGIYKLNFKNNDPLSCYIASCEEIIFQDQEMLTNYLFDNIGFEGVAVDSNYFYLGLEGFTKGALFADSTYIYIIEKKSLETVTMVGTKSLKIGTICGLYAKGSRDLIGVDRNQMALFEIKFNADFTVSESNVFHHEGKIPGYPSKVYFSSLESITSDDEGAVYVVDDPWKKFFVPGGGVLSSLDKQTQRNFTNFIPILYKYYF